MALNARPKALVRTPKEEEEAFDRVVSKAADVRAVAAPAKTHTYEKGVAKGSKRQITHTIAPELLREVDEAAERSGQTRTAIINLAISRALRGDVFK